MERTYTLRLSKHRWKIPLYCYHECSGLCFSKIEFAPETNEIIFTTENTDPDAKCALNQKLLSTSIHIASFDCISPNGHAGRLYNPDLLVVPDNRFSMTIDFPLSNPVKIQINSIDQKGYTLREILWLIYTIYFAIYDEEELNALPQSFVFEDECSQCLQTPERILASLAIRNGSGADCSVCYNTMENQEIVALHCGHIFHHVCLQQWITTGRGQTCPLCRSRIIQCDSCRDGIVLTTEEHVVLPYHRRTNLLRNTTNGPYGIHSHDLESLFIENLYYNNTSKQLSLDIKALQ